MKVHMFKIKKKQQCYSGVLFFIDRLGTPKERPVNLNIRNFLIRNS